MFSGAAPTGAGRQIELHMNGRRARDYGNYSKKFSSWCSRAMGRTVCKHVYGGASTHIERWIAMAWRHLMILYQTQIVWFAALSPLHPDNRGKINFLRNDNIGNCERINHKSRAGLKGISPNTFRRIREMTCANSLISHFRSTISMKNNRSYSLTYWPAEKK